MPANPALPLVILGAGGLARELLGWMARLPGHAMPTALVQTAPPATDECLGLPVLTLDAVQGPARFIVGVGSPRVKRELVQAALERGWVAETYVDPSALIGLNVSIGRGAVICPFCTVSTNASIGEFATLNCRSGVGHESVVGSYSTLLGSNNVNGNVEVGSDVTLGCASSIHPGRRIGHGATVGIGAVVISNVRAQTSVFGVPAKRLAATR
ncbi:MAG: hypothetical protein QM788_11235 [Roseateles sp.]|uniref:hypothetical protein n=1 Tax=Roseateles sp. TaxID=1971397 RepID=UPI0039EB52FA